MATLSFIIPDADETRIYNALAIAWNYVPGAETKKAFVKRKLIEQIKSAVVSGEAITSRESIKTNVESISIA